MNTKLYVRNLTISFRTNEGKVQAVRGINFDLNEGETLAIVGESGSGKSVTSKAILGILSGNSIIEGGEIIYDGKDLLKISEEEFHKIRGDKIAMIFQDPMSSLNPIARIGKQLTEAMILKGKARQKESRISFNSYLKNLKEELNAVLPGVDTDTKCKNFDKFEYKHLDLEAAYNDAHDAAIEAVEEISALVFELEKKAASDVKYRLNRIRTLAKDSVQTYVVDENATQLLALCEKILPVYKSKNVQELISVLSDIKAILAEAIDFVAPNFFALGYYYTFSKDPLPELDIPELNKYLRKYLDEHFMLDFIENVEQAVRYSAQNSIDNMAIAIQQLKDKRDIFAQSELQKKDIFDTFAKLDASVKATIDPLAISKDSLTYTFGTGVRSELERYFYGKKNNKREEAKYKKQLAKHNAIKKKGKTPNWTVAAPSLVNFELVQNNILNQIDRLIRHYEEIIANQESRNYNEEAIAIIDYLKACASGVVHKVTYNMAKNKALKLLEEVGISEPRKRFKQYPFEFSGGMRQRIVIAIALAANPDILICDEPTTALDVTIQSQILELINKLKRERNLTVIFITHDLGVVANMADRIAVMYAGKIVEYGTSEDVFYHPAHPYTWALLSSMPDLDTNEKLDAIPGTPPNMIYPPVGDAFADRNKYAMKIDFERQPPMFKISDTHYAATWLLHPNAPKIETPKIITDRIARMKKMKEARENGKQ
ncbi:MAG: ATP-binding cassette domain-containing protein [Clostridia bacterium]|nr:ATP-binding cassette domain-containing protein [Clostridia bacterium]